MAKVRTRRYKTASGKHHYEERRTHPDGSGRSIKRDGNKLIGNKILSVTRWDKTGKKR